MDTVAHAVELQKRIDELLIKIVKTKGAGQSQLVGELNKILRSMPKPSSKVCEDIARTLADTYKKQGFLAEDDYAGRFGDENILKFYDRMLKHLPRDVLRAYHELNNAVINMVARGDITQAQAVDILTNAAGYRGVTVVTKSGRKFKFETLVAMQVRNELREATNHAAEDIATMLGTNIYQVDSHIGARPLCSLDQGKLFSDTRGTFQDLNGNLYPVYAWFDSTMGDPAGLFGVNCRHIKYPMVQGFSMPSREDPMLKVIKRNQRKVQ